MTAYYNENDRFAAAWLRELIAGGHIAEGEVDEREIREVEPADLKGFTQCHFFAGIGVWSYALRSAGWGDDEPVWTGSCPCQPFSSAGKRLGTADVRHLWPEWWRLIEERHPDVVFGEQVASPDGLAWLDIVQTDLEGAGYAFAPFDLCAAGFGAPHQRQRLYFVAESGSEQAQRGNARGFHPGSLRSGEAGDVADSERRGTRQLSAGRRSEGKGTPDPDWSGQIGNMADPEATGLQGAENGGGDFGSKSGRPRHGQSKRNIAAGDLGNAECAGFQGHAGDGGGGNKSGRYGEKEAGPVAPPGFTSGFWRGADWVLCRSRHDPGWEWRPIEFGTFPLAYGLPASMGRMLSETQRLAEVAGLSKQSLKRAKSFRVGSLRGYGNAINSEVAEGFIRAYRETVTTL